jgi:hypothetical protein
VYDEVDGTVLGDVEGLGEDVGLADADGDADAEGDGAADGEGESDAAGETDGDGLETTVVRTSCGAVAAPASRLLNERRPPVGAVRTRLSAAPAVAADVTSRLIQEPAVTGLDDATDDPTAGAFLAVMLVSDQLAEVVEAVTPALLVTA